MAKQKSDTQKRTVTNEIAMTRGMNPLAALSYVRETKGPRYIEKVLQSMSAEDLRFLAGGQQINSKQWIPFMVHAHLLEAIDRECGVGNSALLFEVGRHMSARDVPRFFRPLIRLGNPGWIVEVATRLWRTYHNKGIWTIQRTPMTILATLNSHAECHEAFCLTFVGWLTGALELSGGYDVLVDHPVCQTRGAPSCVYTARWTENRARKQSEEKTRSVVKPSGN